MVFGKLYLLMSLHVTQNSVHRLIDEVCANNKSYRYYRNKK